MTAHEESSHSTRSHGFAPSSINACNYPREQAHLQTIRVRFALTNSYDYSARTVLHTIHMSNNPLMIDYCARYVQLLEGYFLY